MSPNCDLSLSLKAECGNVRLLFVPVLINVTFFPYFNDKQISSCELLLFLFAIVIVTSVTALPILNLSSLEYLIPSFGKAYN